MNDNNNNDVDGGPVEANNNAEEEATTDRAIIDAVLPPPEGFGIRRLRSQTNFLFRVDALRINHIHDAGNLFNSAEFILELAKQFYQNAMDILIQYSIYLMLGNNVIAQQLLTHGQTMMLIAKLFVDESWLYYLDFMDVVYFPLSNRRPPTNHSRFHPIVHSTINSLTDAQADDFTGFNKSQLRRLYTLWRLHDRIPMITPQRRDRFTGEEMLLYFLYHLRHGSTFRDMSGASIFGGDPRRFSHAIRALTAFLYTNFYHKITGDSMRLWTQPDTVMQFRESIYERFINIQDDNEEEDPALSFTREEMPFERFRPFAFLDDYGIATNSVGDNIDQNNRPASLQDRDIQRSFYSGYFRDHGLKVQVVYLPNGFIGSVWIGSLAHNDQGMQNFSGLNDYLITLLQTQRLSNGLYLPALYADGIFRPLPTIIPRHTLTGRRGSLTRAERIMNKRMSSCRVSIEHVLGLHSNLFAVFRRPELLRLYHSGVHKRKMITMSFFVLNCYLATHQSTARTFGLIPPSLEEYLPTNEQLTQAPPDMNHSADNLLPN